MGNVNHCLNLNNSPTSLQVTMDQKLGKGGLVNADTQVTPERVRKKLELFIKPKQHEKKTWMTGFLNRHGMIFESLKLVETSLKGTSVASVRKDDAGRILCQKFGIPDTKLPTIMVAGLKKSGKSSLINRFCGINICPEEKTAMTIIPWVIQHGDAFRCEIFFRSDREGEQYVIDIDDDNCEEHVYKIMKTLRVWKELAYKSFVKDQEDMYKNGSSPSSVNSDTINIPNSNLLDRFVTHDHSDQEEEKKKVEKKMYSHFHLWLDEGEVERLTLPEEYRGIVDEKLFEELNKRLFPVRAVVSGKIPGFNRIRVIDMQGSLEEIPPNMIENERRFVPEDSYFSDMLRRISFLIFVLKTGEKGFQSVSPDEADFLREILECRPSLRHNIVFVASHRDYFSTFQIREIEENLPGELRRILEIPRSKIRLHIVSCKEKHLVKEDNLNSFNGLVEDLRNKMDEFLERCVCDMLENIRTFIGRQYFRMQPNRPNDEEIQNVIRQLDGAFEDFVQKDLRGSLRNSLLKQVMTKVNMSYLRKKNVTDVEYLVRIVEGFGDPETYEVSKRAMRELRLWFTTTENDVEFVRVLQELLRKKMEPVLSQNLSLFTRIDGSIFDVANGINGVRGSSKGILVSSGMFAGVLGGTLLAGISVFGIPLLPAFLVAAPVAGLGVIAGRYYRIQRTYQIEILERELPNIQRNFVDLIMTHVENRLRKSMVELKDGLLAKPLDPEYFKVFENRLLNSQLCLCGLYNQMKNRKMNFTEKIGSGGFGEVWKGVWTDEFEKPHQVAIKLSPMNVGHGWTALAQKKEAHFLMNIKHPNLLRGYQIEEKQPCTSCFYVGPSPDNEILVSQILKQKLTKFRICSILPLMDGDVVEMKVLEKKSRIERLKIAAKIVEGVRRLHQIGVAHRDLKLWNVLIKEEEEEVQNVKKKKDDDLLLSSSSEEEEETEGETTEEEDKHKDMEKSSRLIIKVADFGLSKNLGHHQKRMHTGSLGTGFYADFRMKLGSPKDDLVKYGLDIDIFSLGLMLLELWIGELYFDTLCYDDYAHSKMRLLYNTDQGKKARKMKFLDLTVLEKQENGVGKKMGDLIDHCVSMCFNELDLDCRYDIHKVGEELLKIIFELSNYQPIRVI